MCSTGGWTETFHTDLKNTISLTWERQTLGPSELSWSRCSELCPHTLCPASCTSSAAVDPWSSPPQTCDLKGETKRMNKSDNPNLISSYLSQCEYLCQILRYSHKVALHSSHITQGERANVMFYTVSATLCPSPVLLQSLTLPGILCFSRLCCRMSPNDSMTPPLRVLVNRRFRP